MYAKKEIEHDTEVVYYTDLFTPLFRNVSVFKRYVS
jgi:hypothetical protein